MSARNNGDRMGQIVEARIAYLSKFAEAEELKRTSDALIRASIKDQETGEGHYSVEEIAKALYMPESAIVYIRDQDT